MAKKIKLEITEPQLLALIEITNEASAMLGCGDRNDDCDRARWIRLIDRMLKNNGYKRTFN